MNKLLLTSLLLIAIITPVTFFEFYVIRIEPKTSLAQTDLNSIDTCSPDYVKSTYFKLNNQATGVWSTYPCLEQINQKLDKLISLEEQENKP